MKQIATLFSGLILFLTTATVARGAEETTVRALLFYSPTCSHCHQIMEQDLPTWLQQYGSQLRILMVDVSTEQGDRLYQSLVAEYGLPRERLGVPALALEGTILVGSMEISARFPALIKLGLEAGGTDWPRFVGFNAQAADTVFEDSAAGQISPDHDSEEIAPIAAAMVAADKNVVVAKSAMVSDGANAVGFVLAALLTLVMVGAVGYVVSQGRSLHVRIRRLQRGPVTGVPVPILVASGLVVALFLAYVEISAAAVACGPIGHCNLVQASSYSRIAGVPVAIIGVVYYLLLALMCFGQYRLAMPYARMATATLLAMAFVGTLFSIYLTCLELFVIEAICAWCVTSALITMLVMVVTATTILERVPAPEGEGRVVPLA